MKKKQYKSTVVNYLELKVNDILAEFDYLQICISYDLHESCYMLIASPGHDLVIKSELSGRMGELLFDFMDKFPNENLHIVKEPLVDSIGVFLIRRLHGKRSIMKQFCNWVESDYEGYAKPIESITVFAEVESNDDDFINKLALNQPLAA